MEGYEDGENTCAIEGWLWREQLSTMFTQKKYMRQYCRLDGTVLYGFMDPNSEVAWSLQLWGCQVTDVNQGMVHNTSAVGTALTSLTNSAANAFVNLVSGSHTNHQGLNYSNHHTNMDRAGSGQIRRDGSGGVEYPSDPSMQPLMSHLIVIKPPPQFVTTSSAASSGGSTLTSSTGNSPGPPREIKICAASLEEFEAWMEHIRRATGTALLYFYDIGEMIGHGTFGKVYKARNSKTGELVAIKAISKNLNSAKEVEYLQREVQIMTSVSHPNIVKTLDIFDVDGKLWFVMELLLGGELFDIISEAKRFTEAQAAEVSRQIISGIAYLHEKNIVHRDLKPENILCKTSQFPLEVKITDFGLSNIIQLGPRSPRMDNPSASYNDYPSNLETNFALQSFVGTPRYIAPEIALKMRYGPAVDVFSAGVILYILLSGKFPFWGNTDEEYIARLRRGVRFPPAQWEFVSDEAKDLIAKMCEFDPLKRISAEHALQHPWFDKLYEEEFTKSSNQINTWNIHSKKRTELFLQSKDNNMDLL